MSSCRVSSSSQFQTSDGPRCGQIRSYRAQLLGSSVSPCRGRAPDEDLVHLVHGLVAVGGRLHLVADGGLDQPVHLDRVAGISRSTLASEKRVMSVISSPSTVLAARSRLSCGVSDLIISSLLSSVSEIGSGAKQAQSSSSRAAAGDWLLSRSNESRQVTATEVG